jgi:Acetyltransferase (GNAT) domain
LNGTMIAVECHLKGYGKDHAMRGHYLPESARLSPGTFLEMQILKSTFEDANRVKKYDFGGSFDNYKRKWTDDSVPHQAIWVFGGKTYSRLIAFHEKITVPLLRRTFPEKLWHHKIFKIFGISPNRFDVSAKG